MKLLLLFVLTIFAQHPALSGLQEAFRSVAQGARPACVNITAAHEEEMMAPGEYYFMDPEEFFDEFFYGTPRRRPKTYKRRKAGTGSGVIIDEGGHVLTNAHVVEGATEIKIRLEQKGKKKIYKGRLIGRDDRLDLALLKIEGRGPFPSAPLGNSEEVQVGDWAIAIGSPFELEQTLTVGVISALRQSLPIENRVYRNLIQTDAAINRGNSGGPLINIKGEVIGINTAIFSPSGVFSGIGFAIPINAAKEILPDLQAGRQREWGWLGVSAGDVTEVMAKRFGLDSTEGAVVNEVFAGGPAQEAGLAPGDVITHINSAPIKQPSDLTDAIRNLAPGAKIKIAFIREDKKRNANAVIGKRPKWADIQGAQEDAPPAPSPEKKTPASKETSWTWEGLEILDMKKNPTGRASAKKNRLDPEAEGVILGAVEAASPAAGYLEAGDLILELNRRATKTIGDFQQAAKNASFREGVVFQILRGSNRQFISIQSGS